MSSTSDTRSPNDRRLAWAGALAFALLVGGGLAWGLARAQSRSSSVSVDRAVLRVAPGEPATMHRHAFTLGRPSRITVRIVNPQRKAGTLRVGPPTVAKVSAFDTVDAQHTKSFPIPAQERAEFTWLDLAVGTRVINIQLEAAAQVGLDVHTAPPR